ncbi:MAG: nucleotide sugar dehydrogenase [Acidobacteria bacterium]|nr:nucleotide sugar dehydrogenase [Acidobacteriota bacterium]MBU4306597.1 nucleotide sugar dehydrogenase [Acidobacteriota bacterium]MCG2812575.1 nucleotide sugar dehydrogenase [Candidatus Aminicenantes bacterium]
MKFAKNILCIGAGYVGGPTMAVIAAKCPSCKVTVVDINEERIRRWNSDDLPIFEPGLLDVVRSARGRNLFFSNDIAAGIRAADIIFVSVNTPTKTFGHGAGMASDLQYWEKTAHEIVAHSDRSKIIVEKSTLPVRTAEAMECILQENKKGIHFEVISNPEFLSEGSAVMDLLEPDRVLIGSRQTESGRKAAQEIVAIFANWVAAEKIITSNLWSAELSKLVANAFLAQRISSINAVSALCEKTDADVAEISFAVGSDKRIGPRFLNASVGFGGSCFKKDILNLVYICRSYDLNEVADYWQAVIEINEYQQERFVRKIIREMFNTIVGKRIVLLGFAFKANTGDTRESPGIFVAGKLLEERALLVISDPQALENARKDLAGLDGFVEYEPDPYRAVVDAQAIAVITEWDIYRKLDFAKIFASMRKPAFLFDGRNILDHQKLFNIGFNVFPLGKPSLTHFK